MCFKKSNNNFDRLFVKALQKINYVPGKRLSLKKNCELYIILFLNIVTYIVSLILIGKSSGLACLLHIFSYIKLLLSLYRDNKILAEEYQFRYGIYPKKFKKSPYDYQQRFGVIVAFLLFFLYSFCAAYEVVGSFDVGLLFRLVVFVGTTFGFLNSLVSDIAKLYKSTAVFR